MLRMCAIHRIIKGFSVWRKKKLRDEREGLDGADLNEGRVTKQHFRGNLNEGK